MSFECPICMNEFNTEKYIPKLLKCGDTICIICLKDIFKKKKNAQFVEQK